MNERRRALLTVIGTALLLVAALLLTPSSDPGSASEGDASAQPASSADPLSGK